MPVIWVVFGNIRSIQPTPSCLLWCKDNRSLDEESFAMLMAQTEGILNSWPLTTDNISDPTSSLPLSPSSLSTMKSRIILPPKEDFWDLIYTATEDGGRFNTYWINFGVTKETNSCNLFKKRRNGQTLKGIWRLDTLWSCK